MTPLVLWTLQIGFLLLLYLFIARAVRAVVKDVQTTPEPAAAPAAAAGKGSSRRRGKGSGSSSSAPRKLVVHSPEHRPRVIELDGSEITFGRSETSTVMLVDTFASERHARIHRQGDAWVVADLGSTNGTYLNNAKVTQATRLTPGDRLAIGKTVVEVRA